MTTPLLIGPVSRSATRDEIGHREYTVNWQIRTYSLLDGPAYIMNNWPLPAVGSVYNLTAFYSGDTDVDNWAFCTPELNIAPHRQVTEGDPHYDWIVTQKWTTNPKWRCQTLPIENPLLEPFDYTGDFTHEQRVASVDRFGVPLLHPNHQPITGAMAEYKYSYPTINITFNYATLPLATYVLLINKVNDAVLWDLPARCVRFIDAKWERLVYGTCFFYFRTTYTFEFDIGDGDYSGFDRPIPAEGTTVKRNGGSSSNPEDFILHKVGDENTHALLDQYGNAVTDPSLQHVQYPEISKQGNLLLLGIPATL